jgi:ectoine hydroxylase-related dioxygenase (phytanoyl-CoA dioxygenase family)
MAKPSTTRQIAQAHELDYTLLRAMTSQGWIRSSGPEGDTATVWHEDVEYVFSGRGLVDFLYAVKDSQTDKLYAVEDLLDYIEKSAKVAPSVFVRDAVVSRAAELRAKMRGES